MAIYAHNDNGAACIYIEYPIQLLCLVCSTCYGGYINDIIRILIYMGNEQSSFFLWVRPINLRSYSNIPKIMEST